MTEQPILQMAADPVVTVIGIIIYLIYQLFIYLKQRRAKGSEQPAPASPTQAPRPVAEPLDPFHELLEALGRPTTTSPTPPAPARVTPPPLPKPRVFTPSEEGPSYAQTHAPTPTPALENYQAPVFHTRLDQEQIVTAVEQDAYITKALDELPVPDLARITPSNTAHYQFLADIRESVRRPESLRRSIILNEILSPPLALQARLFP